MSGILDFKLSRLSCNVFSMSLYLLHASPAIIADKGRDHGRCEPEYCVDRLKQGFNIGLMLVEESLYVGLKAEGDRHMVTKYNIDIGMPKYAALLTMKASSGMPRGFRRPESTGRPPTSVAAESAAAADSGPAEPVAESLDI